MRLDEATLDATRDLVIVAARETGLAPEMCPAVCPWTFAQMMDPGFLPDGAV